MSASPSIYLIAKSEDARFHFDFDDIPNVNNE